MSNNLNVHVAAVGRFVSETILSTILLTGLAIFVVQGAPGQPIAQYKDSTGAVKCEIGSGGLLSGACVTGIIADADDRFVNTSGDSMTGALAIINSAGLTASGTVRTDTQLASSGTLVVEGAATLNSTLALNGVTYTFPTDDGSATGKVLKTDSTGQLSWSDDLGATAIVQSDADSRYVNVSGDTMTGALNVQSTISGAALNIMAGANSYVMGNLGVGTVPTTIFNVDNIGGATVGLFEHSTGNRALFSLADDDTTGYFGVENGLMIFGASSAPADSTFVNDLANKRIGIGTASPTTKLEVVGTISGSTVYASGGSVALQATTPPFPLVASGTNLSTGAILQTFVAPSDGKFLWAACKVDNAATDGLTEIDILINGISIFTTKPTIDALERSSLDGDTPAVVNDAATSYSVGDTISFNATQVSGGEKVAQGLSCFSTNWKTHVYLTQP